MAKDGKTGPGSGKAREDSTMEVEVGELRESRSVEIPIDTPSQEAALDGLLGDLEAEVDVEVEVAPAAARPPPDKGSIPPPLPPGGRPQTLPPVPPARPPTQSLATARARSVPPPPPGRPLTRSSMPAPNTRSVPPPPPPKPRGLGRAGDAPPRRGVPTQHGLIAPRMPDAPPPPRRDPSAPARRTSKINPFEPDSEEQTLVAELEGDLTNLREPTHALAAEWKKQLAESDDPARQARLSYELARLYEGPLRDLAEAQARYRAALELRADHLPSLRGARRTAMAMGSYREALPLFDTEARVTADSRRKAALLFAKGRVLEDHLDSPDEARKAYATAAELHRGDPTILKALEQRDLAREDWARLERTLEMQANAVSKDARHRAALVVERARLLEHRDQRVDAAIELYETALRLDPQVTGALDALERLCHSQRRWRDLIGVLRRKADLTIDPTERALALYRMGRLHGEKLGNREEARLALEEAAHESPDDPLVLEELATLHERDENWGRLVEVLARLSEVGAGPGEQLAHWHRIGTLLDERLRRPAQAREAFERAFALDATHRPTLQALGRLYESTKSWDALVAMHLAEAEAATEDARKAAAHARVAEVLERRLDEREEAVAHHARALALRPGYAPSFKALGRLYAEMGRHRALIELYERAVEEASEAEPAITYLFKIGALYEDSLAEPAQAAHVYRRILERDPTRLGAMHALQRATERAGRHVELVEALELEAALRTEAPRVVDLLTRAAEVLDERLDDATGAIARYRRVLELDAACIPALAGLGRLYHRSGRWDDLLELYEKELVTQPEGAGAAALLHKMGQLCEERIGDEGRAIECYRRALDADARHRPSLAALARRLDARRDHEGLVKVLELELEGLSEPTARARAAFRLGEVHDHLGAPEKATTAYESALAAVPTYAPARDALARIRGQLGAWRRLVDQLEGQAAESEDEERTATNLARAGELWANRLGDPRRAIGAYERVLAVEPTHIEALLALEKLYRKVSRGDALPKIFGGLARVLTDPGARVSALRELARCTDASRVSEQRSVLEAILSLVPDDPGALEALEAIALAQQDRALLVSVDQRLVAKAGDPKIASAYQTRLAESLESAGDPGAIGAYRGALGTDPDNIAAVKGLARVAASFEDAGAVAEAARRESAMTTDPQRSARLLVRAGRTARDHLRDGAAALADFELALERWPDEADAAAGLAELLLEAGEHARAADRLARAAAAARKPERIAGLWMEVARIQADLSGDVPAALASLDRVLRDSPAHVPTLRRAAHLHRREGRHADAAELLAKVVSLAPDQKLLRDAHLELAEIWDEHLDDPTRARVSLQAVLSLSPDHPVALARLARLSARTGDPDKAAATLARLVESAPLADKPAALLELSAIEARRGQLDAARRAALQAIAYEGPGGAAVRRHKELMEEARDWQEHAEALRAWLKTAADPLARRRARVEIARVLGDELRRPARAVGELEKAVREQPTDVELRTLLAVALRQASMTEDSISELRRLVQEHPTRAALWRELASSHRAAGDPENAMRALGPLALLSEASGEERRELDKRPRKTSSARASALDESVLAQLYPTRKVSALTELLRHLMPGIGKLYPPDFDAYGLSSRDRITSRSAEPIRKVAERVARVFGVDDFHLYLHRARARGVAVELSDPPSIVVPSSITELSEAHQVFALARPLADIAVGLYAFDRLTPRELEIVLAAICRRVEPDFGSGLTGEDVLDDIGKRLYKALPRRARKGVDELAQAYVSADRVDFAQLVAAVVTSGHCISLLLADDLLAAIDVLKRTERDLASLDDAALVQHPLVMRLVRFWVGNDADTLRERIGTREPTRSAAVPTP